MDRTAALRGLPRIDELTDAVVAEGLPRFAALAAARRSVEAARAAILRDEPGGVWLEDVVALARALAVPSLRQVINATGVVLHTNLGRAPLSEEALRRVVEVGSGYSNLELDLEAGERGSRHSHVRLALCELTGAEDAVVVNNGAAAVLLALAALAAGREVVVSRGELIEIGGGFRVPDVMAQSGARLVEVGTTNKTHRRDVELAISGQTSLLLKVHRSNFAVVGFTAEVSLKELVAVGRLRNLPVMLDLGSGALRAVGDEPTVGQAVSEGADVVVFSGDKLLGGPQAGILVGRQAAVARCAAHPLMRAVRPDKLTLAALEGTLDAYRRGEAEHLPIFRMLEIGLDELRGRAERLGEILAPSGLERSLVETTSKVGGGSLPLHEPASLAVALVSPRHSADELAAGLRRHGVISRIAEGRVLLDLRTVAEAEIPPLGERILAFCRNPVL